MLSSELLRTAALGLVIGGLGGLAVPGRHRFVWVSAAAFGVSGALGGGFIGSLLLGTAFPATRLALAGLVAALVVCGWTLYLRERSLPR